MLLSTTPKVDGSHAVDCYSKTDAYQRKDHPNNPGELFVFIVRIQGPDLRGSPQSDKLHNCDVMIREDVSNLQMLRTAVHVTTSTR